MMIFMALQAQAASDQAKKQNAFNEGLIADIATGNMQALEEVYAASKSAVYGFALSILKDAQAAEDVMQDTYVTLFNKAHTYRPQGKPMSWMLAIVRNLALMRIRKQKHETTPDALETMSQPTFAPNSIDKMVLQTALTTLGDEERQIVMLHCVAGLKHKEISELLDIPLGTTLSRYHRALKKLQQQLQQKEDA